MHSTKASKFILPNFGNFLNMSSGIKCKNCTSSFGKLKAEEGDRHFYATGWLLVMRVNSLICKFKL